MLTLPNHLELQVQIYSSRVYYSPDNISLWSRKFEFYDWRIRISGRKDALVISSLKTYEYRLENRSRGDWVTDVGGSDAIKKFDDQPPPLRLIAKLHQLIWEKILSASFLGCLSLVFFVFFFETAGFLKCLNAPFFGTLRRRRAPPPTCWRILFLKTFFIEDFGLDRPSNICNNSESAAKKKSLAMGCRTF